MHSQASEPANSVLGRLAIAADFFPKLKLAAREKVTINVPTEFAVLTREKRNIFVLGVSTHGIDARIVFRQILPTGVLSAAGASGLYELYVPKVGESVAKRHLATKFR